MPLVTLDTVKTFLGIPLATPDYDTVLTMFKDAIEAAVIHYCCTDFTTTVKTNEIHDGTRSDVLTPYNIPVLSVQDVLFGVEMDGSGGYSLDSSTDYRFDENSITLRNIHTPKSRGIVRIDYTYGYASVPADVTLVVAQSVKAEFQRWQKNAEDVSSRSKGDESESFGTGGTGTWDSFTGLPKAFAVKLQPYRVYEFPNINTAQRNL